MSSSPHIYAPVWQTIWSFDLIMYAVGVFTTVVMMIGLLYVSRLSLIPWVLVR